MTNQDENLPKVPPFVTSPPKPPTNNHNGNNSESEAEMLRVITMLISTVGMGIALVSGAVTAIGLLMSSDDKKWDGIGAKLVVLGLAYLVGWVVTVYSIRKLSNLVLPIVVQGYMWLCMAGICALYITIIARLFSQKWGDATFMKFSVVMIAALIAMIGLHLILENHSLVLFAVPLLAVILVHLYMVVFHYIFLPVDKVKYDLLKHDIVFLFGMAVVSILLMTNMGFLKPLRRRIDQAFSNGIST